jgi:hypothetical protein
MHLVLSALGVIGIGALYASKGAVAVLLPCLALWTTLLSLGFLSEMKPWAARFEFTRLLLVVPVCVAGTAALGYLDADILERVTAGALVLIAASAALLARISQLMRRDGVCTLLYNELRN